MSLQGGFYYKQTRKEISPQKPDLELITNHFSFFLNSGLDDFSTKQTVNLLRVLAKGGRTIVCTIHQPSATLLNYFDSVYVLGQGRCVYQGCVKNLLPFLSSAGFRCPTYHNPADYRKHLNSYKKLRHNFYSSSNRGRRQQ